MARSWSTTGTNIKSTVWLKHRPIGGATKLKAWSDGLAERQWPAGRGSRAGPRHRSVGAR
jgi:hypothetical protein